VINVIDVIALVIVLFAIWMGARSGFVVQVLALAGFAAGVVLLIVAAPYAAPLLDDLELPLRSLLVLLVMASVVLLAQGLGSEVGAFAAPALGQGLLGGVDRAAGGVFGVARGIFLVWLLGGLLAVAPMPALATEARTSLALRAIDTYLPSPLSLAAEFGRVIQQAGLPDVFADLPPPPAEPVDSPDQQQANEIAAAARASTLRVEAIACGRFMTGTGFADRAGLLRHQRPRRRRRGPDLAVVRRRARPPPGDACRLRPIARCSALARSRARRRAAAVGRQRPAPRHGSRRARLHRRWAPARHTGRGESFAAGARPRHLRPANRAPAGGRAARRRGARR
jgi:membrane protein required for colicin V production